MIEIKCAHCDEKIIVPILRDGDIIYCSRCSTEIVLSKNMEQQQSETTDQEEKVSILKKIRGAFRLEWTWRLFLVSQTVGLLALIVTDLTSSMWSIVPDFTDFRGRFRFEWDVFDDRYWTRDTENWKALIFIFGPFPLARGIDWIVSSKNEEKESP